MIAQIEQAALNVGISTFVTNSEEKIDIQLSRLTREADKPSMLVSWDINVGLNFDENGFLENPSADIVCLLMTKAGDTTKESAEAASQAMAVKFQNFIQELWKILIPFQKSKDKPPISNANYKLVPMHGMGKHSGVLGKWTMRNSLTIDC